jgi:hypothetical protein
LFSLSSVVSPDFIKQCIDFTRKYRPAPDEDDEDEGEVPISPTTTTATSDTPDPRAVSRREALSYYIGLPSMPTLLYRTGKKWYPPSGPEAYHRRKELCEVFKHPIVDLWNDSLALKVVDVLDAHTVS